MIQENEDDKVFVGLCVYVMRTKPSGKGFNPTTAFKEL